MKVRLYLSEWYPVWEEDREETFKEYEVPDKLIHDMRACYRKWERIQTALDEATKGQHGS